MVAQFFCVTFFVPFCSRRECTDGAETAGGFPHRSLYVLPYRVMSAVRFVYVLAYTRKARFGTHVSKPGTA